MIKYTFKHLEKHIELYNKHYQDITDFVKTIINNKNLVVKWDFNFKEHLNEKELEKYLKLMKKERRLNKRGIKIRKSLGIYLKGGNPMKKEHKKKYKMQDSDWKEVIEQNLVEIYTEKLYNMSLAELQVEAEKAGFDISELFGKK